MFERLLGQTGPSDVKVLMPAQGVPMRFDEVGEDFYALTPAEAKALMDASAAKRAKEERFLTQVYAAKPQPKSGDTPWRESAAHPLMVSPVRLSAVHTP